MSVRWVELLYETDRQPRISTHGVNTEASIRFVTSLKGHSTYFAAYKPWFIIEN